MAGSARGRRTSTAGLTGREIEVLALCAEGYADKEIASTLEISVYTVGNHLRRILRKTESQSRTQAVVVAIELGYLGEELRPAVASAGFGGRGTESSWDASGVGETPAISEYRASLGLYRARPFAVMQQPKDSQLPDLHRDVLRLAAGLQETVWDSSRWLTLLEELAEVYRSHLTIFNWYDLETSGKNSITHSPMMGEEWMERYDTYFAQIHPLKDFFEQSRSDMVIATEDFEFTPEFYEHPFYTDYMRPLEIENGLGFNIALGRWYVSVLVTLSRERGALSARDRELATLLFPHLRYALRFLWEKCGHDPALPEMAGSSEAWESLLENGRSGQIFLDRNGHPIYANSRGERVLAAGTWMRQAPGGLAGVTPESTEMLREAVGRAARAGAGRVISAPETLLLRAARRDLLPLRATVQPLVAGSDGVPAFLRRARVLVSVSEMGVEGAGGAGGPGGPGGAGAGRAGGLR